MSRTQQGWSRTERDRYRTEKNARREKKKRVSPDVFTVL